MYDGMKQCFAHMIARHTDWEIQLHDRASVEECVACYPEISATFRSASFIAQCDIGRFAVVGVHGGVYLDLDVVVARSLNDLLDAYARHTFLAFTERSMGRPGSEHNTRIANYAFAARPRDPFIDLCFEIISERLSGAGGEDRARDSDEFVLWSTGPDVISTAIHSLLPEHSIVPTRPKPCIESSLAVVSKKECDRYFRHSGAGTWRQSRA